MAKWAKGYHSHVPKRDETARLRSQHSGEAGRERMKTKYENVTGEPSAAQSAERLVCALCGSRDAELVLTKAIALPRGDLPFRLWRCAKCDLVRTEPRLAPEALASFYGEEYWGAIQDADPDWIRRDQRHRTVFLHRFRNSGAILDVGCGLGFFLRALDPSRWDRYGVEPMPLPYRQAARAARLGPGCAGSARCGRFAGGEIRRHYVLGFARASPRSARRAARGSPRPSPRRLGLDRIAEFRRLSGEPFRRGLVSSLPASSSLPFHARNSDRGSCTLAVFVFVSSKIAPAPTITMR